MKRFSLSVLKVLICVVLISAHLYSVDAKKVSTRLSAPSSSLTQRSSRHKVKSSNRSEMSKIKGKINFMAYDKKTGAAKETFFVDNGSDLNLSGIEVEITYLSSAGRQIHKRKVEINQDFPARETRKVDIPSWDAQKSFHYINSVPSPKGSTPYSVRFKVLSYTKAP